MSGWSFACPDWEERLRSGRSLVPDLPLDRVAADQAVAIFNRLRLPDVVDQPTLGEAAGDWFRDVVRAIFGSLDPVTGVRMVPDTLVLVPKKNSKTTNGAALMLTAILMNRRRYAPFAMFGPTQEIADIAFQAALGMIECDVGLKRLFQVQEHLKRITYRLTDAVLKITTFDPAVATGGKYAGWLLDEAHLLSRVSYATRVIGQLRGARTAVPESFGLMISTQSEEPPGGAFKAELKLAREVRDGTQSGVALLPVLYEFPEAIQTDQGRPWRQPENWPLVLPNLGRSVSLAVLEREYAAELAKGDEAERRWASQHLNIEIGLALHSDRWNGVDFWERCGEPSLTLDTLLARSEVVIVGVDGGGLDDLLGIAVLGRDRETKAWLHWGHAWADHGVLDLRKEIAERLRDFERDGDLTFVDLAEGGNDDVAAVADIVERIWGMGLLPEEYGIGLDAVGVAAIVEELSRRKIPSACMASVPQGYRLSGVIKGTARKLKDGSLRHGARPLMAWTVGNAKSELRGSAVLITKQAAGTAKIDPLMALFNAVDLMSRNPEPANGRSFWEAA